MDKKVLIVIPAFNEANVIDKVIRNIYINFSGADILIINDGSSDRTSTVAKEAGATVANLTFNLGYGSALQTGYKYALRHEYDYVIQMDGDGQHDPMSIRDLYKAIVSNEDDIIIGSRFIKNTYSPPFARRLGMYFFAKIAEFVTKQKFSDPTSGFRAFNKKAIKLYCEDLFPSDFPDTDVLIMSKKAGLNIKEIPVIMHAAESKKSMHAGLRPVYYIFKMLLSIIVSILRKNNIEYKNNEY
jgi:glycosyltransferase involved in cell wall biosynthesis